MFEIYKNERTGKFHFRLKTRNRVTILTGQAFADRKSCEDGIESVGKNAADKSKFIITEAVDGRHYFVLLAANKQVIGQSKLYKGRQGVRKGIEWVKTNAAEAQIKDLTV